MGEQNLSEMDECREAFAESDRQEAEVMERPEKSRLERSIIERKSALYNQLAIKEQARERFRGEISLLAEQCARDTHKCRKNLTEQTRAMREIQDEIAQANLALRAIQTGAQES